MFLEFSAAAFVPFLAPHLFVPFVLAFFGWPAALVVARFPNDGFFSRGWRAFGRGRFAAFVSPNAARPLSVIPLEKAPVLRSAYRSS